MNQPPRIVQAAQATRIVHAAQATKPYCVHLSARSSTFAAAVVLAFWLCSILWYGHVRACEGPHDSDVIDPTRHHCRPVCDAPQQFMQGCSFSVEPRLSMHLPRDFRVSSFLRVLACHFLVDFASFAYPMLIMQIWSTYSLESFRHVSRLSQQFCGSLCGENLIQIQLIWAYAKRKFFWYSRLVILSNGVTVFFASKSASAVPFKWGISIFHGCS